MSYPPQQSYPNQFENAALSYPLNALPQPGFQPPAGPPSAPNPGYPSQGYSSGGAGYPPPPGYQPQGYGPPTSPYPPVQGQYPPPQGQYPPPQGQYPPPVGQYPPPQGGYPPVVNQPTANNGWMSIPQGLVNCPPGLEYLTMIDQLLVHQKVELLEALVGWETKNKFTVKNSIGQKIYYAVEDSDCCSRNFCGPLRPFDMKIMDNFQNQVIHMHRPLSCDSCCFPCCLQSMEISAPPGTLVGTVEQEWSIFCPSFKIRNASGDVVLRIEGPFCTFSICGEVEFKVLSSDGSQEVGKISKQWSGLLREMFTDTDYFGITFPMNLDVKMKAVMLGACFLIDAMFFEKSGNSEQDVPGML